jgi:hypothetical protein
MKNGFESRRTTAPVRGPEAWSSVRVTLSIVGLVAGCGGHPADPVPRIVDPAVESDAIAVTAIRGAVQITFDWRLQDKDARFSGQGVARVEGFRARVDLFGPRGEAYATAVLDDFDLRLPPGITDVPLPPPPLFWSVLGVFRPPPGTERVLAKPGEGSADLEYSEGRDVWKFHLEAGVLRRAEWTGQQAGRRSVELNAPGAGGIPGVVTYRDWPAFLELRLSPTEVREVDAFPSEIWTFARN